jgi:hypothetical protein
MFNGNLIPIDSGDGPIFEVTVQISSQAEGMVSLNYTQALASDSEGDPSAIYAFGVGGWLDIDALLNIEPEANLIIPDEFLLYQNYPNPFNPVTTIQYDLPNAGEVKVKILNILGQEVATLVNSYQPAGIYRVNWDGTDQFGSQVNSGVYLYQIRSNDFFDTKKMILIK